MRKRNQKDPEQVQHMIEDERKLKEMDEIKQLERILDK